MVGFGGQICWTIAAVLCMGSMVDSCQEKQKIYARVDLVAVMTKEYPADSTQEKAAIIEAFQKLHQCFPGSKQGEPKNTYARYWIVSGMASIKESAFNSPVLLQPSQSAPDFESGVREFRASNSTGEESDYDLALAFNGIREKSPNGLGPRAAAVVVVQTFFTKHTKQAVSEAKRLLELGYRIYAITKNTSQRGLNGLVDQAIQYTGTPTRVFGIKRGEFGAEMIHVVDAIFRDLCQWDSMCRYLDQNRTQCGFEAWQPPAPPYLEGRMYDQCKREGVAPKETKMCDADACRKDCDHRWPWKNPLPDCETRCGFAPISRVSKTPPSEKVENCASQFACPPCHPKPEAATVWMKNLKSWLELLTWTHVIAALLIVIVTLPILGLLVCALMKKSAVRYAPLSTKPKKSQSGAKKPASSKSGAKKGVKSKSGAKKAKAKLPSTERVKGVVAAKTTEPETVKKTTSADGYILMDVQPKAPDTGGYIIMGEEKGPKSELVPEVKKPAAAANVGDYILVGFAPKPKSKSKGSAVAKRERKKRRK